MMFKHVWGRNARTDRLVCWWRRIHYCEPGNPDPGEGLAYHPVAREVPGSLEAGPRPASPLGPRRYGVLVCCPVCETEWLEETD